MSSLFDMKLKIYGYKDLDKSQLSKKSVIETKELIKGLNLPNTDSIIDTAISPRNISRQSRKVLTNLFPTLNHGVRVISLKDSQQATLLYNFNKLSTDEYISELIKKSTTLDVFNAPISFVDTHTCQYGETVKPLGLIDDQTYLNNVPIMISGFNLGSKKISRLAVITHLHEITHALLERNKGSVRDYYKAEMLSILMEKIAADEIDKTSVLLSKQNIFRYESLKNSIKENCDDDTHKYLLSTLLAEALFNKYLNGNETYKNHLLAQIQMVLEGKLVLEDMLNNEGIVLDNGNLPCIIEENIQKSIRNLK